MEPGSYTHLKQKKAKAFAIERNEMVMRTLINHVTVLTMNQDLEELRLSLIHIYRRSVSEAGAEGDTEDL